MERGCTGYYRLWLVRSLLATSLVSPPACAHARSLLSPAVSLFLCLQVTALSTPHYTTFIFISFLCYSAGFCWLDRSYWYRYPLFTTGMCINLFRYPVLFNSVCFYLFFVFCGHIRRPDVKTTWFFSHLPQYWPKLSTLSQHPYFIILPIHHPTP